MRDHFEGVHPKIHAYLHPPTAKMAAMTTVLSQQTRPLAPAASRTAGRAITPAVLRLPRPSLRVQVRAPQAPQTISMHVHSSAAPASS